MQYDTQVFLHYNFNLLTYRSSVHEATGESPGLMLFGREPQLPVDLMVGRSPVKVVSENPGPVFTKGLSQVLGLSWLYFYTKVKVGVLRPVQQPGSYWDRSSELPLVGYIFIQKLSLRLG